MPRLAQLRRDLTHARIDLTAHASPAHAPTAEPKPDLAGSLAAMNHRDSIVCVIIARAGSRGVPGKNVATVAGRPCIAWTIDHALASTLTTVTLVSTDDPVAASTARRWASRSSIAPRRWPPTRPASTTPCVSASSRHEVSPPVPSADGHPLPATRPSARQA
jgi:hypothetical protein